MQGAISIKEYRSSLDRYQDISNFFAYELFNTNQYDLMLPTPRYRSSIIVPYQLNKIANNNEVVNQTVKLIYSFLIKANEHYEQLDQNSALTDANYNYSEYSLPRPVLFQTLVNLLGPEREMVKQKNEAIEIVLPRVNKQAMRQHYLDGFQRNNLLLIPTNHSLNRNKKKFGAVANFVTDHRVFGKGGANIQELKYVVLAFSNYLYMVLDNYQGNKAQIKHAVLSLLYSRSRYSVFINNSLSYESPEIKRCAMIAAMLNIYSHLMHMTFVNRRVMLQRAAYETLIISLCGGIVHSSCKSGKDREGMIVVFTDALLIYIEQYSYCPDLENRRHKQLFADIFVHCFFSGSAMSISAMTALYAYGTKNLTGILPDFLQEALQQHDRQQYRMIKKVSSLNKVKLDRLNRYRQDHEEQRVELNREAKGDLRGRFDNLNLQDNFDLNDYQDLFSSGHQNHDDHQVAARQLYREVNNYRH